MLGILEYFMRPVRFDYLSRYLSNPEIRFLDVGCGNHSPSLTKQYFGKCIYHGVDNDPECYNDKEEMKCIDRFFLMDLAQANLSEVPDNYYHCVMLSHVIEHISNGREIVARLIPKLKTGGIIYIETPSPRSLMFPHMKGTLNFWDDPTHKRIYTLEELRLVVAEGDCEIIYSGIRRSFKRIAIFPLHFLHSLIKNRNISGTVFWDVCGFAHVVVGRRR